ncbi:MAG: NAD(P)-dependent oxidoreductase [Gemmatimonadaceae bacterium]|nr:NAD(P)-dependent oxidoreductase [Gemmatimonadaceae bacterium]
MADLRQMIAVVTGGSGFIGSHLIDALLETGAVVRQVLHTPAAAADVRSRLTQLTARLDNPSALRASGVLDGVTHVFHLAGRTRAHRAQELFRANEATSAALARALAATTPQARLIAVSSLAARGPSAPAQPHHGADAPIESYGASKLAAERALFAAGLGSITIVRPGAVYGPRDRDLLAAFRTARASTAWHPASPDQPFALIHVADLVRALIHVASVSATATVPLEVAGATTTWRALYEEIALGAGRRPRHRQIPVRVLKAAASLAPAFDRLRGRTSLLTAQKLALALAPGWTGDDAPLRALGWAPCISLTDGVRDTLAWYRAAGWCE